MNFRNLLIGIGAIFIIFFTAGSLLIRNTLQSSLPQLTGTIKLQGLKTPALVESDRFAIPTITAASRLDAYRVLGYLTARDRLFQVDLMRRKTSGRLAEIFGERTLESDIKQRHLGSYRAAQTIFQHLPEAQKKVLEVFSQGFNQYLEHTQTLPFEFVVLGYRPEYWKPEDSILVALTMFQRLTGHENDERMLTIMDASLPQAVVAFFTPDSDEYDSILLGGPGSYRPARHIPVTELALLLSSFELSREYAVVEHNVVVEGSNNWAVSGRKTTDGRAILANDMHLAFSVPNIWFRAVIRYGGHQLSGVVLPGLPLLIAGSNTKVAWGHTNLMADVIDLVSLEINPANPSEYLTPEGWKPFEKFREIVRVKGSEERVLEVKNTIWGPVSPRPLLGCPVAVHWTALQTDAINMDMLNLDKVANLEQAVSLFKRAGIPPTNIMLADDKGRIGWTFAGKFPLRFGFDGAVSLSWSRNSTGWRGYIAESRLPSLIDPPSGILATANNRTLGSNYPFVIGHNYASSFRAFRILFRLKQMQKIMERDMLNLQLDTHAGFYEFYRKLAVSVLTEERISKDLELAIIRQIIENWDGKADQESKGLATLIEFRKNLAAYVINPFLRSCWKNDSSFRYRWYKMDTPLRLLLKEKIPALLPDPGFENWDQLIVGVLKHSVFRVKSRFAVSSIKDLNWGLANRVNISHPFSRIVPSLSRFLDMPVTDNSGCGYCIKVIHDWHGASQRMVISPGRPENGIFHMPGGQSGHPLSPHYRDQHPYWEAGLPLQFSPGPATYSLRFVPL